MSLMCVPMDRSLSCARKSRKADCCCFVFLRLVYKDIAAKKGTLAPKLAGVKNICFLLTRCWSGALEDWGRLS